jgi:hypothetical protein
MLKLCPNCNDETEVRHGICTECGEELFEKKKREVDEWSDEDEWSESEWDQFYKYERR